MPHRMRTSIPKQAGDAHAEHLAEVEKAARKAGYEKALAKWQEAADTYPAILDDLLTAMCQMAVAVEDTESARQELIVLQRQLAAEGIRVGRPSYAPGTARLIADASRGRKAVCVALGVAAKTHVPKAAEGAPESA
jgi:hypothetical protein